MIERCEADSWHWDEAEKTLLVSRGDDYMIEVELYGGDEACRVLLEDALDLEDVARKLRDMARLIESDS